MNLHFIETKLNNNRLSQGNISLDINNLQQDIMETFSQKLHLLQGSNLLEAAAMGFLN